MVQGTTSDAGKSTIAAGLCRVFARRGWSVAPFKSQNMANNSAVTPGGGEIGRAQAFQARAAGVEPHVDMNPVLLKPCSDTGSQVVVLGKPVGQMGVREYHAYQPQVWPVVTDALDRLRSRHDLVVIEGAGSPAEVNLRHRDIANMAVALHAQAPVLLVADIDRGGMFASVVGTHALLSAEEQALLRGVIVNKFRGDVSLLTPGLSIIEERTGAPVLGVLPYLRDWRGEAEDSLSLRMDERSTQDLVVAAVRFPRLSNATDLDAVAAEPDVAVRWVTQPQDLAGADAVVLPGTKSTMADLAWLRAAGIADAIVAAARSGVPVVGICGGYQMLGRLLRDPDGVESTQREVSGLGLLGCETMFLAEKRTVRASGRVASNRLAPEGTEVEGYEIHMGRTERDSGIDPLLLLDGVPDGAVAPDAPVFGTYLHGLFDAGSLRRAWLDGLRLRRGLAPIGEPAPDLADVDVLAAHLEAHLDIEVVQRIIERGAREDA